MAAERYRDRKAVYREFAGEVAGAIERALAAAEVPYYQVQHRAKSASSLAAKASRLLDAGDGRIELRYPDPLRSITDLAGARVITYFKDDLAAVRTAVQREFGMAERWHLTQKEDGGGYESWHCLVRLPERRLRLIEHARFADLVCEVQLRTLLQHAWAQIEHGARYKTGLPLSPDVDRLFAQSKHMLDAADHHFDGIRAAQRAAERRLTGRRRLDRDGLAEVIDALCPPHDGSISDVGYDLFLERLDRLGLVTVEDLEALLAPYDVDALLAALDYPFPTRQYRRFEDLLLAAVGASYIALFAYAIGTDRHERLEQRHHRLLDAGILPDPRRGA
jgi:ppGpp synthetase/RelA/SpoT-type nucleotidyltranferase